MASSNYITKVAIVGAGGNSGKFMAEALLKTGKHVVTAISRSGSQSRLPEGVTSKEVDYDNTETLVEALRGQDALIITLSVQSPDDTEKKLIEAASEAGVSWILPNDWSPDTANEAVLKDVSFFQRKVTIRNTIQQLDKTSYIAISTGFWYEWSLAVPEAFGIDLINHSVTFFDSGETKISISTWPQVGRAVAALLSLPVKAEGSNKEACLDNFKNKVVYINSFTVSQEEMLESALRVTSTKKEDWTITKEPSHERYVNGIKEMKEGKRIGFAKMMYSRIFFPDGVGDVEHSKGTINALLDLPKENIDEATKRAIERSM